MFLEHRQRIRPKNWVNYVSNIDVITWENKNPFIIYYLLLDMFKSLSTHDSDLTLTILTLNWPSPNLYHDLSFIKIKEYFFLIIVLTIDWAVSVDHVLVDGEL